ncbi:MAG: ErfK/YbiS/YcfS/YnhG family protein [uncultured bacterium]|nr:MAG: ErfK/YbiS/YcfS/YnhG family protein [uncultured bacterium]
MSHLRFCIRCLLLILISLPFTSLQALTNEESPPPYYAKDSLNNNRFLLEDNVPLADKNYQKLREALPLYQYAALHPWPTIPDNNLLKRGANNSAVPLLRARLQASHDLSPTYYSFNNVFDEELVLAVKKFQQRHGLKADGVVGQATRRELNIPPSVRAQQIAINMQRWARLSSALHDRFIMVNVPDFKLYVFENNHEVLSMKAIVGKRDRQTPEIISRITRLVLHPYWNVPRMIASKDIIPKVINDPYYLDDMHIRIFTVEGGDSVEMSPYEIDWETAQKNGFQYFFRQDPGDDNALGQVKFEFPNSKHIYLHDTPAKELFDADVRTFSSGCIRLENPFALVDYLMKTNPKWDEIRLQDMLDTGETTYVKAARPTPIVITYITAWVDEKGDIQFRDDVYGKDE